MAVHARLQLVRAIAALENPAPKRHEQFSTTTAFGHPDSYFWRAGVTGCHACDWEDYILGKLVKCCGL